MLLVLMAVLMFLSSWDDTATSDDNVALVSGYSYLRTQDYRLEAQNPPLIKDLAALPLLFMTIQEPWSHKDWAAAEPDSLGRAFLYQTGNDADAIMRAARTPMILFSLIFGAILFVWTRNHYGDGVGLLTLFFYTFSPTVIAHSRFVATDLGATAGFFIAITAFLHALKQPSAKSILLGGFALGFALLTKFSTIALLPIFLFLAVVWGLVQESRVGFRRACRSIAHTAGVVGVGFLVVYVLYLHNVWHFTTQREVTEIYRGWFQLGGTAKDIVLWSSANALLRPWAQYFLGLLCALKASKWGQPVFFLGQAYSTGVHSYFPIAYLLKEPLGLHLATLGAIFGSALLWRSTKRQWRNGGWTRWIADHFTEFSFLVVLTVFWAALIRSHMNIGVRHLLPAFPFMFVLISRQIVSVIQWLGRTRGKRAVMVASVTLGVLLSWQALTVLRVHPSYLAYFNELARGPDGGWMYLNDSNLDWGQDVRRLAQFLERQGAQEIHAVYFGPPDPQYYFPGKYRGGVACDAPPKGWVAISAMFYAGKPFTECDYRRTLPIETLKAKIGYSIFVFYVE